MLQSARQRLEVVPVLRLASVNPAEIAIDCHGIKSCLLEENRDRVRSRAFGKMDAREDAFVLLREFRGSMHGIGLQNAGAFQPCRQLLGRALGAPDVDEVTIHDEQPTTWLQDPEPFAKAGLRIHQRPDKVSIDDDVVCLRCFHRALGVADKKADGAAASLRLGARALKHGFGPVDPRYPVAEIVHEMRNDAGAAGEIQRLSPFTLTEVLEKQGMPGLSLLFRKDFVTGRLVEGFGTSRPVVLDLVTQSVIVPLHYRIPFFKRASVSNASKR